MTWFKGDAVPTSVRLPAGLLGLARRAVVFVSGQRQPDVVPSVVAKPVAGIPTTETHPNGEAKSIPLWMDKEKAMRTPLILPKDMTQAELLDRLRKARDYNSYQRSLGQPHHCTSEPQIKLWLVRSSYDHRLSRHVFPSLAS
jgi:hypothetical protein